MPRRERYSVGWTDWRTLYGVLTEERTVVRQLDPPPSLLEALRSFRDELAASAGVPSPNVLNTSFSSGLRRGEDGVALNAMPHPLTVPRDGFTVAVAGVDGLPDDAMEPEDL